MTALGIESELRLESLVAAGQCLGLEKKLIVQEMSPDLRAKLRQQFFFVIDDDIARLTLTQMLATSFNSWVFYQLMLDSCDTPELNMLLRVFVKQQRNVNRILEEVQNRWDGTLV